MAEIRVKKVEQGQTKIRNVPIAVTPEGFWCCPSPVMFQKNLKTQHPLNKPRSSSSPTTKNSSDHRKHSQELEKKQSRASSKSETITDDQINNGFEPPVLGAALVAERAAIRPPDAENLPRKVSIEFGEPGTGDLKVVLFGKQGFIVKLSVHKVVVEENSTFFAQKLLAKHPSFQCIEIDDCEDVETYVETVGLMYCKDLKQRLIKQSVSRVLRILKVAEQLGFKTCMESCLDFLEAVPWVGEEEEERVVSSVLRLQSEGIGVSPILKRVASDVSKPVKDTLSHVLQLVLKSNEEKGRREMKSVVLKLLRENNNKSNPNSNSNALTSGDLCNDTIYTSCIACLDSLLVLFRQVAQPEFTEHPFEVKDSVVKQMVLEADNLSWLLDILADRHAADEYAVMWASQQELAGLHSRVSIVNRHHISCITARLFVGIGRGEILSSKDTRHLLLKTWLQPLIDDYSWLQHGCKSFDRKVVEEGIGRTILTLPLEDQQIVMLGWLSSFLKAGDNCPNLQKAFEVWWRRTFVRPYAEPTNSQPLD